MIPLILLLGVGFFLWKHNQEWGSVWDSKTQDAENAHSLPAGSVSPEALPFDHVSDRTINVSGKPWTTTTFYPPEKSSRRVFTVAVFDSSNWVSFYQGGGGARELYRMNYDPQEPESKNLILKAWLGK